MWAIAPTASLCLPQIHLLKDNSFSRYRLVKLILETKVTLELPKSYDASLSCSGKSMHRLTKLHIIGLWSIWQQKFVTLELKGCI